jgi:hypothetical protein
MCFEDDVFISYRHLDNQIKDDKGKGWVDNFHERLEYKLAELLGYEPKVWRDTRMQGNVYIAGHLQQKLRRTKVLISIFSPGYINSAWCVGELNEFCRLAEESGGLEINGKLRVFKVAKLPSPIWNEPKPIKDQVGYSFYEINQASKEPEEFAQELGSNKDKRYWDRLTRLAWAIKFVLDCYRDGRPNPVESSPFNAAGPSLSKGAVYLAETTFDRREDRERIKDQLEQSQYEVLPDKLLPPVSPDYEQAVAAYLRRAKLSVHLLGSSYAGTPEAARATSAQLQLDLAIQQDDSAFARLIWLPTNLEVTDERQQGFIRKIQNDSELQKLAEFRVERLQDLTTFILKKLEPPPPPPGKTPSPATAARNGGNGGPISIYLVYDVGDSVEAMAVEDYLFNQGYEVVSSLNWSPKTHERNLKICDSLLVYHRNSNDDWLLERRVDLIQARGLREGKRFYAKAFYLSAPPETEVKTRFKSNEALVIRSSDGFDPSALAKFFDEIAQAKGAAI